jgi:hypothetical protein
MWLTVTSSTRPYAILDFAVIRKYNLRTEGTSRYDWHNLSVNDGEGKLGEDLYDKYLRMTSEEDYSLWHDLRDQATTLYNGGRWEPYAGGLARYYVSVEPGSKNAPQLDDLIYEIRFVLGCTRQLVPCPK